MGWEVRLETFILTSRKKANANSSMSLNRALNRLGLSLSKRKPDRVKSDEGDFKPLLARSNRILLVRDWSPWQSGSSL